MKFTSLFVCFICLLGDGKGQDSTQHAESRRLSVSFFGSVYHPYYDVIVSSFPTSSGIGIGIGFGFGATDERQVGLDTETYFILPVIWSVMVESDVRLNFGASVVHSWLRRNKPIHAGWTALPIVEIVLQVSDTVSVGIGSRYYFNGAVIRVTF